MTRFNRGVGVFLLALTVVACDDADPFGDDAGTMTLLLTDAAGDFRRAIVTIQRIELIADSDDDVARVVLRSDAFTTDLLTLSNDVAELVDEAVVPGGTYAQLRFVISGGCVEVERDDGTGAVYASQGYTECGAAHGNLQMPSLASSGLKVNLPAGFRVSGDQNVVLVDFDVAESFGHAAGGSGQWVMHPVIRASEIAVTGGIDVAVTVADTVQLPDGVLLDDLVVRLDAEPGVALVDGAAELRFLLPGTYAIDVVAPDGFTLATAPTLPVSVTVASGAQVDLAVEILALE